MATLTRETHDYMPLPIELSHIAMMSWRIRAGGQFRCAIPATGCEESVYAEYDDKGEALRVHTIVISTQHR